MRYVLMVLSASICVLNTGRATAQEISFDLQIANPFTSIFRLENTSTVPNAEIVGFAGSIGNAMYNFDIVGGEDILSDSGNTLASMLLIGDPSQGGARTDNFEYALDGFEPGDRFAFFADLDLDTGDSLSDLREIYFNNGDDTPNAFYSVTFDIDGETQTLDLLLPDDPLAGDPQVFDFSVSQAAVPEPNAATLLGLALTLGIFGRRKNARQ